MKIFTRRFRENVALTLALAGIMSLCFIGGVAKLLDARFSDLLFLPRAPHADIVIVTIDDKSIQAIGQWPWKRSVHAQIVNKIFSSGAKAIGYDVNFPEPSSIGLNDDAVLADAIRDRAVVLPVELTLLQAKNGWVGNDPLLPIPELRSAARIGMANVPREADGVVRSVPLSVSSGTSSYEAFAFVILSATKDQDAVMLRDAQHDNTVRINFVGPPGTFPRVSAVDVLQGRVNADVLKNKIVLVGATAADLHDDVIAPTSAGVPMPGVEVHANILDTLLSGNGLHELPIPYGVMIIFLYAMLIGVLLTRFKLRYGTFFLVALMIIHVLIAIIAFGYNDIVPILWPVLSILITYVAIVAVRYFHEQRERQKLRSTLNQYLSPTLVNDLLANPDKIQLGGERRNMTVLFSDLRGFTTLSEGMSPEMLVHVLNTYLDVMTEQVFATNGVVDKYMGDAIMAFWGASFLEPDHTDRAVITAIKMRSVLNEMNAKNGWPNGVQLNLGIGVNTGDMVVGNMGSSKRFDYTVMGDAVNLGSRVEGINKEYGTQIIATEFAKRATTPGKFVFRTLDLVAVKGKKEPVEIFEVIGESATVSQEKHYFIQAFEEAIKLYRAQKFVEASSAFGKLAEAGDYAAKMYVSRCEEFMDHPPGEEWNGVWVYTKK